MAFPMNRAVAERPADVKFVGMHMSAVGGVAHQLHRTAHGAKQAVELHHREEEARQQQAAHARERAGAEFTPSELVPPSASSQWEGLTAFRAGPRRDPESRQVHVRKLADSGRLIQTPGSTLRRDINTTQSIHTSAVLVPDGCPNSWETDRAAHVRPERIVVPSVSAPGGGGAGQSAGAAHEHLGLLSRYAGGPKTTYHYHHQTVGFSEENRRNFLLTGERARKHAGARQSTTDTLGLKENVAENGGGAFADGGEPAEDDRWTTTSHAEHSYHSTFLPRRTHAHRPIESNSHASFGSWAQEV